MTRHGLPKAMTPAGMSRVTTLPAPMTVPSPIVTPCMTTQFAADPDVVADGDRKRAHDARVALVGQQGVVDGVDAHVGADEYVVADGHGCFVEDREVEIPRKVVPD